MLSKAVVSKRLRISLINCIRNCWTMTDTCIFTYNNYISSSWSGSSALNLCHFVFFTIVCFSFNRAAKIEDALTFAQTQMSEAGESNPEVLSELERTLALLAFEQPQKSPFSDLLEQSHRQKVSVDCHPGWDETMNTDSFIHRWPVN